MKTSIGIAKALALVSTMGLVGCEFTAKTVSSSKGSSGPQQLVDSGSGNSGGGGNTGGGSGSNTGGIGNGGGSGGGDTGPAGIRISNLRLCYRVSNTPEALYQFHGGSYTNMTTPSQVGYVIAALLPDEYGYSGRTIIDIALASPGRIAGAMEKTNFTGTQNSRFKQLESSEFSLPNVSPEQLAALYAQAAVPRQHPQTLEWVTAEVRFYTYIGNKVLSSSYVRPSAPTTGGGATLLSEGGSYAFQVMTPLISRQAECSGANGEVGEVCNNDCDSNESPLVLDLKGNGVQATSLADGVRFDIDADGKENSVAWIKGSRERGWDDAFLARDINKNGKIDNGSELFGSATRMRNGSLPVNGFIALKELDSNSDNKFDRKDKAFREVVLWMDRNQDGKSQRSELIPVASLVKSIDLRFEALSDEDQYGNMILASSKFTDIHGQELNVIDIFFKFEE